MSIRHKHNSEHRDDIVANDKVVLGDISPGGWEDGSMDREDLWHRYPSLDPYQHPPMSQA